MYHIPNDKRALHSADALCQGLLETLNTKELNDVVIQDICMKSNVSRSTFYRLFDNISDILYWKCERVFLQTLQEIEQHPETLSFDIFNKFAKSWTENGLLIDTLIRNNRTEILNQIHQKYASNIIAHFLSDEEVSPIQLKYLSGILAAIIPAGFQIWRENPKESDAASIRIQECLKLLNKMFQI